MNRPSHQEQGRISLAQAEEELAKDDLRQASEKGWGAASQMVKAVADARGWDHKGHAQLFKAVGSLAGEHDDKALRRLFSSSNDLHINFYDGYLSQHEVSVRMEDVALFVRKMDAILAEA
ncbi:MAG: PaREP1 family protein [Chloroflexi bacterium]|nr:PaREP1 family protein [Chloroflexota bacterium]